MTSILGAIGLTAFISVALGTNDLGCILGIFMLSLGLFTITEKNHE